MEKYDLKAGHERVSEAQKRVMRDNGITEGVIWKQLLLFFFPILLGSFFQQMYNMVDTVVVGRFAGTTSLAAVGTSGTLVNLLFGFFVSLASGATVVISQFFGSQSEQGVHDGVHTGIAMAIVGGLAITVIGLIVAPFALVWMNVPEDVRPEVLVYLRIFFCGMVVSMLYNVGAAILRALGDSRRPMIYLIVCCFANVALDLLLVVVIPMGVAGVAIATVLAQAISAALVVLALMRQPDSSRLVWKDVRIHKHLLMSVLQIGIPAGMQSCMYSVSNIIIQSGVNSFGSTTLAAWTAFGKTDAIVWMVMGAFGTAITTFVGQNFGAQKYERMRRSVRVCMAMALGSTLMLTVFVLTMNRFLLGLFTSDTAVIDAGAEMLWAIGPYYILYVCIEILAGAMRGCGESLKPMLLIGFGICLFRVVWVALVMQYAHTVPMLALSYPLSWGLTSVMFVIYYLRGNWLRRRISVMGYEPERR